MVEDWISRNESMHLVGVVGPPKWRNAFVVIFKGVADVVGSSKWSVFMVIFKGCADWGVYSRKFVNMVVVEWDDLVSKVMNGFKDWCIKP